ncbi:MAG: antibiotic biosynthesis monooxygenase [Gammaproteobacteria bacterium]|nr:MAG: antibiotic biosynthesis monooxygenase [Gammaproteobacteria bacterium]
MYIAMNRFKVVPGQEEAFEDVWRNRDTQLDKMPGFREFHLLKGPTTDEYSLYSSHTVWNSREDFENWTHSQAFRDAHKGAGKRGHMYLDHPHFEGFEAVL